jgi:hypothetical protein
MRGEDCGRHEPNYSVNIGEANAYNNFDTMAESKFGIPVIALVPVFWPVLQSERINQSRDVSVRTGELLAGGLADQLADRMSPATAYVNNLAAAIKAAPCRTVSCVFMLKIPPRSAMGKIKASISNHPRPEAVCPRIPSGRTLPYGHIWL